MRRVPGAHIDLVERESDDFNWTYRYLDLLHAISDNNLFAGRMTGEVKTYINTGSYNYLGFAENNGPCAQHSIESIKTYGISPGSPRSELGMSHLCLL